MLTRVPSGALSGTLKVTSTVFAVPLPTAAVQGFPSGPFTTTPGRGSSTLSGRVSRSRQVSPGATGKLYPQNCPISAWRAPSAMVVPSFLTRNGISAGVPGVKTVA